MHVSLLAWRRYRFLWWSLGLTVACTLLFVSQGAEQGQPPNGGTWQGYTLGTVGALLIVWLSLLGIRKRSYRSTVGSVQGWTSAHVYLGTALLVIATLHAAAQFGLNVHTLAFVLMCVVVLSGFFGLYFYSHLPALLAKNNAGRDSREWIQELAEVDRTLFQEASRADASVQLMVQSALEQTNLGGRFLALLGGVDKSTVQVAQNERPIANAEMQTVLTRLAELVPVTQRQREADTLNALLAGFGRRQTVLKVLRREARLRAWLRVWLYLHVPVTVALLGALTVHVVSVFVYW